MPGIQVVGTATGAGDGLSRVALLAPDVVLVDTTVVGMLGLVRTLTTASPPTRVVALALPERSSEVVACAEAGALGYVTEDASIADLVATVEGVVRGEMRCSPRITATLFRRIAVLAADTRPSTPMSSLTGRELEVLALLGEGLSNKQIAQRLCIEIATAKNHVHRILEKLGVGRRGEAGAYFHRYAHFDLRAHGAGPATLTHRP